MKKTNNRKVLVAGAGGFIGGHLVKQLVAEGDQVIAVDIKPMRSWYQESLDAISIPSFDLSLETSTDFITKFELDDVYMLACDMGGMGFIHNHKVECMYSVLISTNMARAAAKNGIERYLYSSSACIYPNYKQESQHVSLKETDAYPADPEPGYGLEKLFSEELAINLNEKPNISTYVPRLHNVFGPFGTYQGGREKAPAAICRKIIHAKLSGEDKIDVWGDGEQTRSFMYIDDCLEGFKRIINSDYHDPINLGSDELVTINKMVEMVQEIAGTNVKTVHDTSKPQGVRGRCSNNDLIKEKLDWAPSISLVDGLEKTYAWIYDQMIKDYQA
jgi:nucleoside-diphosphate-sugar epimerase